jgi:hypothetical protein
VQATMTESDEYPRYASHFVPRTLAGRLAVAAFVALMAMAQPPIVFALANRIEPWLLGMPFLFSYLLLVYAAMIAVLVAAARRNR